MKTYKVTITEKLEMTVEVEAPSKSEAVWLAEKQWKDGEHILGADNFTDVSFKIQPPIREREYER